MAVVRRKEPAPGDVPVELLDPTHPVWRDPDLFGRWCQRQGITEPPGRTWAERFQRGRDAWAMAAGFSTHGGHVDRARVAALGVPHVGALARAQARAEA